LSTAQEGAGWDELPQRLKELIARSTRLQERIKRLDGAMERMPQEMPANNNPVGQQIGRIAKAFGRG
jgi:regulator of CtrA degradation